MVIKEHTRIAGIISDSSINRDSLVEIRIDLYGIPSSIKDQIEDGVRTLLRQTEELIKKERLQKSTGQQLQLPTDASRRN